MNRKTMTASAAIFAAFITSALADGYNTYAGQSGLVTTVQKAQIAQEKQAEADFRNMSLADRWENSGPGSFAERWDDNQAGSIARRWNN